MQVKYYEDDEIPNNVDSIFLAGPTPRKDEVQGWRGEALNILQKLGFDGVVYVPENKDGKRRKLLDVTPIIDWELKRLERSTKIVFWVPRELKDMPAFTTNVEFGYHLKTEKVVYGRPDDSPKNRYLDYLYNLNYKAKPFNNLKELLTTTVNSLKIKTSKIFFTSDTHFGSQRHLELSKRPFKNVDEMDRTIIQNWNKQVSADDLIYHIGDFGNFNVLNSLNGRVILILGNYERKEMAEKFNNDFKVYRKYLLNKGFYEVIEHDLTLQLLGQDIFLTHMPLDCKPNMFNLFGHIHERQLVKKFGLNVGIDCKHFALFDLETIEFYKTAIDKFYDNNVFCNLNDISTAKRF